jgi:hypothetical protein
LIKNTITHLELNLGAALKCGKGCNSTSLTTSHLNYSCFNPYFSPGSLLFVLSQAVRDAVGSQTAAKIAIDRFVASFLEENNPAPDLRLSAAIGAANRSVFDFGQRLGGGGRTAARFFALLIYAGEVHAARASFVGCYLRRASDEMMPLFENQSLTPDDPMHGIYLGTQPFLTLEVSSLPVIANDILVISSSSEIESESSLKFNIFAEIKFGPASFYLK